VFFIHSFLLLLYMRGDPSRAGGEGSVKRHDDWLEGASGGCGGDCRLGHVVTNFVL
jgi:hypothetical protein